MLMKILLFILTVNYLHTILLEVILIIFTLG